MENRKTYYLLTHMDDDKERVTAVSLCLKQAQLLAKQYDLTIVRVVEFPLNIHEDKKCLKLKQKI